jgi:putative transposase
VAFIDDHRKGFGVEPICWVLSAHGCQIASSTYYAAKTRPPSPRALADAELLAHIERIYFDPNLGRQLYGARKVWRELRRQQIPAARCTVERLMRTAGLGGARRGRRVVTTRPDKTAARPPDLVNRNFHAERPNALWVVDLTYVPTWSQTAFTAFVSDVFSRRIVGWRTAASMPTSLPLDALEMAIWIRARAGQTDPHGQLAGLVHHSDAGSQYTSIRYTNRLLEAGAVASIGTVGDSFDNALAETVVGLYKTECVRRDGPFRGVDDLELATADWVHWFNESRLHSALRYLPPVEYEAAYHAPRSSEQEAA